jgi:GNAT superfamily N-acetyltransferase
VTTTARLDPGDGTAEADHVFRPATADDLPRCAVVWRTALNDYLGRLGRPDIPDDFTAILRLYRHLQATDPRRFVVAERDGEDGRPVIEAFVSALVRRPVWFLSMLFVLPAAQGRGLGRRLIGAVAPLDEEGISIRATATDSVQPISNGLYTGLGIIPRVPMFRVVGRADRPDAVPPVPPDIEVTTFAEIGREGDGIGSSALAGELNALDREVLGFERQVDHAFMSAEGRQGFLFSDGAGAVRGYGYTSEAGRVGPVVVSDEALLGPVVGHLVTAIEPRGAFGIWVPGSAGEAIVPLLRAGFRIDDFPTMLCWDRPFADWSRALPISPGLL